MLQNDHGLPTLRPRTLVVMQQIAGPRIGSTPEAQPEPRLGEIRAGLVDDSERVTLDEIDLLAEVMITAAEAGPQVPPAALDRALGLR